MHAFVLVLCILAGPPEDGLCVEQIEGIWLADGPKTAAWRCERELNQIRVGGQVLYAECRKRFLEV